jgi:CRISPR/Cas system-associated protein Cas10 (large subunit of type III CRISPR-Cas system)
MAEVNGMAADKNYIGNRQYQDNHERIFGGKKPCPNCGNEHWSRLYGQAGETLCDECGETPRETKISVEAKIAERIDYIPPVGNSVGGVFVKDPKTFKSKLTYEDFQ